MAEGSSRAGRLHPAVYKVTEFVAHSAEVLAVNIGRKSADLLATCGEDRKVNVWSLSTGANLMVRAVARCLLPAACFLLLLPAACLLPACCLPAACFLLPAACCLLPAAAVCSGLLLSAACCCLLLLLLLPAAACCCLLLPAACWLVAVRAQSGRRGKVRRWDRLPPRRVPEILPSSLTTRSLSLAPL
jgi:hypothetical protein